MSKHTGGFIGPTIMALCILGLAALLLSGCASPAYVKLVKPITHKVGHVIKKVGEVSDFYRDPPCEDMLSDECRWQNDAFDRDGVAQ